MKILNLEFLKNNEEFIISEIKKGKIFIYPTDTVLGIGSNAINSNSIKKIYEIKKRENKPLLIITPNINWINENCEFEISHKKEIELKLPGPFSFIVKLKNKEAISKEILNGKETIGIRIPDCIFTKIIEKSNLPFVTTSVNFSGKPSATSIKEINKTILSQVDYIVETNETMTKIPSSILDITKKKIKKIR